MSGHYVLIQGAVHKIYGSMYLATIYASVFLATVNSLSLRIHLTFGDNVFLFFVLARIMANSDIHDQFSAVYLCCGGAYVICKLDIRSYI